jgi:DNA-binding Lrp family transcriptional regulator
MSLDALDRAILNRLQAGFPIAERPYAEVAAHLGTTEAELLRRLQRLLDEGVLSRFGPLYDAGRMGGGLTLAAMRVGEADFERVAAVLNAFPEVAHNYARAHRFNLWFVLATEEPGRVPEVIDEIERQTGYPVHDFPKEAEYFVGLRLEV